MRVLGLDTSHYANSVGIIEDDNVLADITYEARTDSLVKIIANIDAAIESAHMNLADVGGFGVGLGPGSWTGIRVGVTVGKMLAYATGKPVCGTSTLEALAYEARDTHLQVCPIISAGTKDAVYSALYRVQDSLVQRVSDYYVGTLAGLAGLLTVPVVIVGEAADFYAEYFASLDPDIDIEVIKALPRGATIATLAAARLERGAHDDPLALTPLYLKEYTARVFQSSESL